MPADQKRVVLGEGVGQINEGGARRGAATQHQNLTGRSRSVNASVTNHEYLVIINK